ncbi:peptide-methionine (S)-S-oxide reductase MsrA [Stieleria varia]|uniref:Peptide methionine sulfoxide reductase MsrA n=1 Tax=Stieleria varia TaxID=2528005 RepID=A0A5C6A412_9BACT|nr:peptide-methionine (S)-S-oxide reductase MsrA [Stieleria varia]TWT94644.1 Peptide methionine sulfoxide reductase MsrA [Stieleria varia]
MFIKIAINLFTCGVLISCTACAPAQTSSSTSTSTDKPETKVATFAGGCFWCMEPAFDKMPGVISTTSGYTGGRTKNPTYEQVKTGRTGHIESMKIQYNPAEVTYEQLLTLFWHNIDPTQADGQFCDEGNQYRSMIFYHDDEQKKLALASKSTVEQELGQRVHTEIEKAATFYDAEDYHQDYYVKNPTKYKFYRWKCGRDQQLQSVWKDKAGKP